MEYNITEDSGKKTLKSKEYNFYFNKVTGFFARWGKTLEDNPEYCKFGCEIIDIETTTACGGIPDIDGVKSPCNFCYKSNTENGIDMSYDDFVSVFNKLPSTVCQIAFGTNAECSNPSIIEMMEYSRSKGVIPNVTVANISDETAKKLANVCGAVAVSCYEKNRKCCYNSIKRLNKAGFDNVNIHVMVSEETYTHVLELFNDYVNGKVGKIKAIVLLSLKEKGRGIRYNRIDNTLFNNLVDHAFRNNIPIGFDSCSCSKFLNCKAGSKNKFLNELCADPCESGCYSFYISADAKGYPCSFCSGVAGWDDGIDMLKVNDFEKEVWNGDRVSEWRRNLLKNNRNCPIYDI